jgi:hypothetical protein
MVFPDSNLLFIYYYLLPKDGLMGKLVVACQVLVATVFGTKIQLHQYQGQS